MTIKERILHMILFEILALIIFIPISMYFTNRGAETMAGLAVAMTLIAMIWNFLYNWGFDLAFGENRIARSFLTRLLHGIGFEAGMVITSFPLLMWALQESFLQVLVWDIGAVVFFFLYAMIFNWLYDQVREKYFHTPA